MDKNGEAVYGTFACPIGDLKGTTKGAKLYVFLEERPGDTITLSGLTNDIQRVSFLATGEELPFDNAAKTVTLPADLPDAAVTVVAVDVDGEPVIG